MELHGVSSGPPSVSVVAPCYNEEEGLREFWGRVTAACQDTVDQDYEIILVDDGSKDGTWSIIKALSECDPRVVGVRLFRNHGHQLAATAGLSVARGDRVMLIDADLQDPPELLKPMMGTMDLGADVVYGKRTSREGETWFKLLTAATFYRFLTHLTTVPIPRDAGDFRLMNRRVVEALLAMPERQRFIRGMVSWIGGRQVALPYERNARFAGTTKYPLQKMVRFAVDAITSFSTVPLRLASWLGAGTAIIAFFLVIYTVWQWWQGATVTGWASVVTAIAIFSGAQLLVLGILGEYLGRLFQEIKGRPLFLVDTVLIGGVPYGLPADFSSLRPSEQRHILALYRQVSDIQDRREHGQETGGHNEIRRHA
ncbi:glycosyltransferase (plasmid) [Skermanella sp. TT6]|uniref:Glycosyltransferase n=1 Tax=Skermanella cutis TaxID=2775420 RepID=A0ABX7BKS3_9PROT|nr:glycosyltransferase family 2 protein [Skermanella sp. TT6]QQP93047.1 glycosyltransferase [Skermanella sp. TT6]